MPHRNDARAPQGTSRRNFLSTSAAVVAAGSLSTGLFSPRSVHAAGSDVIKVGLIGCGGRGTGAATQAMAADKQVKITALGDAFADRLQMSLDGLKQISPEQVAVTPETSFVGFDAYKQVIDSGVDVVLLCTPPHFRPLQFKAAVAAGKHVFAEKPIAVDAPGVRSVLETVEEAKKKNLSVVSGLCYRYDLPKRETMKQIHDGVIGDIQAMHVSYNTGTLWNMARKPEWSDMEYQMRNWLYYTWLSGDHNVEQHVHSLDKAAWAMKDEPPVRATALSGRQVRTQPEFGHIYDHHAVVYEYASGMKLFAFCRQQAGCSVDVSDYIIGTKGTADIMKHQIAGETDWRYPRGAPAPNMYQQEHDELFASIRSGQAINNGEYMCRSSMMAILGRMAGYTGQTISWDQAMASKEDLTPAAYEWGTLATPVVATPGVTTFV
jgi:predicted dehydrogenase